MTSRILLVDDEEAIRNSLGEILRIEGYNVVPAESGEAAVEVLKKEFFDLVLLDIKMPGMDGLEVLRFINQSGIETKVILLTAHGSLESAIDALREGAHDYILKPANSNMILQSVERGLTERTEMQRKRYLIEQLEDSVHRLRDAEGMARKTNVEQKTLSLEKGVTMDIDRREIWRGTKKVTLTPTESRLMKVLLEHRGRVLSHKELVFLVQGYETTNKEAPEVLRPIISRLRRKLAEFPKGEHWVVNVRGTGYLFEIK